jgi:cell division protein FtsI/penicillin-binding protein 2
MITRGKIASESNESSGSKEKAMRRLAFLVAILIGLVLVIVVQLFRLQVFQRVAGDVPLPPPPNYQPEVAPHRGLIVDCHGYFLALNTFEYDVSAAPNLIEDPRDVADQLWPILDSSPGELLSLLTQDVPYVLLQPRVSKEVAEAITSLGLTDKGIYLEPKLRRKYPEGKLAAHLLGFVRYDCNGAYGLEGYYDPLLKGTSTLSKGVVYPWDEALPIAFDKLALPRGTPHLILTLDRNIQYLVERELAEAVRKYDADGGTVIVMDPGTGAILAMASYPSYDPNHFYKVPMDQYNDPAVSEQYEPGSVFKIITMAAGLDAGVITLESTFYDSGIIEVGGWLIQNPGQRAHGLVSMTDILAYSLNVGVAYVSTSLGEERFYTYLRRFGFGCETDIDLYGEIAGSLKTPGSSKWSRSDLGTNSFGQGIAVTPLQMIAAVAAVANRGFLMKPYVVERIFDDQGVVVTQPTVVRQVVSTRTAEQLTDMLVETVERGAELATVAGYDIAGKTGTAQIPVEDGYDPDLTIASFVGYAPADDPRFIVLVKMDKPREASEGAHVAAPVFRAIAERLFVLLDVPPDNIRLAAR